MAEPVKILIEVADGVVSVYSAGVPVQFVVVDYDTAGGSPDELRTIKGFPAYVNGGDALLGDGPAVLDAFEAWESEAGNG